MHADHYYDDMRAYSSRSRFVDTHVNLKEHFGYLFAHGASREDIQKHLSFREYCTEEIQRLFHYSYCRESKEMIVQGIAYMVSTKGIQSI